MKSFRTGFAVLAISGLTLGLAACGSDDDSSAGGSGGGDDVVTVGFVAVGPEGGWRTANENNIKEAFSAENGFDLKYSPASDGSQNSQITAFTSFIDEEVDVILLSATEATGWEDVLGKAQEAEIPVVLLDRGIEPDNTDLYAAHIGPDNYSISVSAAEWAQETFPEGASYVVLEGPAGLSVVNERNKGWDDTMADATGFTKLESQDANWSTDQAKSVFETMLKSHNNDVQLVFAQNDEMGLGAAQAVEAAGLTPGEDVKIITIDGTKAALQGLVDGQLSFVAEYNPLFGETAVEVVNSLLAGESVESEYVIDSVTFDSPEAAEEALPTRAY
ncbi:MULTISPECIES: ABC transporter substrate-binding protein [Sanguibacter]|jgi:ABC-type sugar transport system substrate-binding protein|uniref:ABC transporter substrate-binding protein n=1 Tax=Sanguibacter inulinus TaxID=60922 RepID=A0A853EZB3_9MICO|nr:MULTISPECIES: ABC transporter substrate-binding protein [Sanguibacter]KQT98300.1 sugar ABC transporter substrate-binding protein [Sanguibacter sp. Leaf3]MBF0723013.1 ABC transporter substrate-binding protein [Sanguibacter inulinus]NYS94158.1 ABC transporter substrate-binding protein [Sanguibacter inulinus]